MPAEVQRASEATGARYVADFAALYGRISAEVGGLYEGQLAAKDETIAELRHRADVAEQEAAALRERASAPTLAQDEANGDRAIAAHRGADGGLWGRVRRWWRGEP